jgi:hypothetical protein
MKTEKPEHNYVEIPPNVSRTLIALREMGYDSVSAICDLIDNSVEAGAKRVSVTVRQSGKDMILEVLDDGRGMSGERLKEAMRFGSERDERKKSKALGKFGMGLKTAGLAIARSIYVLTRENQKPAWETTFDMDTAERENRFVLLDYRPATGPKVFDTLGDHGTLIRLTKVDKIDDTNITRMCRDKLVPTIGRVFRTFIKAGLKITVHAGTGRTEYKVPAIDPLMRDHPQTDVRFDGQIDLGGGARALLTIVELPDFGPVGNRSMGVVQNASGFYVCRNGREIMAAQTFGLFKFHHTYSRFRAELSFGSDLDPLMHTDVKKTVVRPNDQIIDRIREASEKYWERSARENRDMTVEQVKLYHAKPTGGGSKSDKSKPPVDFVESDHGTDDVLFRISHTNGQVIIDYNKRNPLVQVVAEAKSQKVTDAIDRITLAVIAMGGGERFNQFLNRVLTAEDEDTLRTLLMAGTAGDTWKNRSKK